MSVKLLVSFGEAGYGLVKKVCKLDIPHSKTVSDIIKIACEDYNTPTLEEGAKLLSGTSTYRALSPDEVYLSSNEGQRMDPSAICTDLVEGPYFIKLKREQISIDRFASLSNQSWVTQLTPDPHAETHTPNKRSRQVFSGHYVPVSPTPIADPVLVAYSPDVVRLVGMDADFYESHAFVKFFSGDISAMRSSSGSVSQSLATPYALSIGGQEIYQNCPFQTGNGYGDGRAISIAEVVGENGTRWELQLKGAGQTPFCRGGDGRAVLRSSVREFLASEAMHNLGVGTTRAIALVASLTQRAARSWFSPTDAALTIDDPRIASYPIETKRQIVREVNGEPNIMVQENLAISCRVSPSFMRVGHIELFARRYRASLKKGDQQEQRFRRSEFRLIVEHMLFREFNGPAPLPSEAEDRPGFQEDVLSALRVSSSRIAQLTAEWMRVGFCQGNFNSDNCLVGGRTMDYGPFGFIERYEKSWNMWSGGGIKYSFRHQHTAGGQNFFSLAKAIAVLLDDDGKREIEHNILPTHIRLADEAVRDTYRRKMGFVTSCTATDAVFASMDDLMERTEADYTMFWRQLSLLPEQYLPNEKTISSKEEFEKSLGDKSELLTPLKDVFYRELSIDERKNWIELLVEWLYLLGLELTSDHSRADISREMQRQNPKYVPREWMLVDAYSAAALGDYGPVRRLQQLFERPYDDQGESSSQYYRRMPDEYLSRGGVSVMT